MVGWSINRQKDCSFLGQDLLQGVAFFQHNPERTKSDDSRPDTTSHAFYADYSRRAAKHLSCRRIVILADRDQNCRDHHKPCQEIAQLLLLPVALPIISGNMVLVWVSGVACPSDLVPKTTPGKMTG
jgi:hypothetical protein